MAFRAAGGYLEALGIVRFFNFSKRARLVLQSEDSECGLACLSMVLSAFSHHANLHDLRDRMPSSARGWSLSDIVTASRRVSLDARPMRISLLELRHLRRPSILHWNQNHYVVLQHARRGNVVILDPASGRRCLTYSEVSSQFTGIAVECRPTANFQRHDVRPVLRYRDLFRHLNGSGSTFVYLLMLSIVLTGLVLLAPFYTQLVIDRALMSGDVDFLTLLAIAFSLLALFSALIEALRAWVISLIGTKLTRIWSFGCFQRLIRLPYGFFERRTTGDIQSRFRSLDGLRALFSSQAVEAVVDSLTIVATLAFMAFYSLTMFCLVLGGFLLVTGIRLALAPATRRAVREAIAADAERDSVFLNAVRGVIPLKNFGQEGRRLELFSDRVEQTIEASIRTARLTILARCLGSTTLGLQMVLLVWVGANSVISGGLSIGMLVAFLAYARQFEMRSSALIERLMMFYVGQTHLERLSDIVLQTPELPTEKVQLDLQPQASLSARRLTYSYGNTCDAVVKQLSFDVPAGSHLAITGPSGSGKSTVLKLLCGLLCPTSGEVLVNEKRIGPHNLASYRQHIAVVMQNDVLFPGTLQDNLTLGMPVEEQKVWSVLESVMAAGFVRSLPMALQTRVGELGDSLSGGERQRIVLARALYRSPTILFLDEVTNQLDAAARRSIHRLVADLSITRVSVSHSDDLVCRADQVLELKS